MNKKTSRALTVIPQDPLVCAKISFDEALKLDGLDHGGQPNGSHPRHKEANKYYRVAAELGLPAAMFNLGINNRYGLGVRRGFSRNSKSQRNAVYWFQQAARAGLARAYTLLGECQEHGIGGFTPNHQRAAAFYRTGAAKGDPNGATELARLTGSPPTPAPALPAIAGPT